MDGGPTIITVDDWIAVYNGQGVRVWAGHSCGIREGLESLGIPFEQLNPDEEEHPNGLSYDEDDSAVWFPEHLKDYPE